MDKNSHIHGLSKKLLYDYSKNNWYKNYVQFTGVILLYGSYGYSTNHIYNI